MGTEVSMVDLSRAPARAGTDRPAAIRTALRRCDYRRTLSLLRGVTDLPDGAPPVGEIAAYAQERLSRLHKRSRTTAAFDRDALQRVLLWLTADELRTGEQALSGEHLSRAIASFERALRIDGRGSRAALLLAMALYRSVIRELTTHDEPELNRTYTDLDHALELLDRAALDPPLRPRAAALARAVDGQRQVLARLRQRRIRSRALGEYIGRYNAFMTRYRGGRMMTTSEKSHARRSLARLATDLGSLRSQYPVESPEGRRLAEIAMAVADMQARLRNVV
jgi:hypothetical protein